MWTVCPSARVANPQGSARDRVERGAIPSGIGPRLDEVNGRLGKTLLRGGRVFAETSVFEGKVTFRPAIVNWRPGPEDVDALVDVLLQLAAECRRGDGPARATPFSIHRPHRRC